MIIMGLAGLLRWWLIVTSKSFRLADCCKFCIHSSKEYMNNKTLFNRICTITNLITSDFAVCDDFKRNSLFTGTHSADRGTKIKCIAQTK